MPSFGNIQPDIEYRQRPSAYAIVVHEELIAVVRTPKGHFLPGGGAKPDESLADAAIRETEEEIGLIVEITGEVCTADEYVHSAKSGKYVRKLCSFFSAARIGSVDGSEPDHALVWSTREEAADLLSHGSQRWAIERMFSTDRA